MAKNQFLGIAAAVAQVTSIQVTGYDVASTYKLTVGGVVISAIAAGGVNQTATALADAWNASAHPYCLAVAAVAATDTVTLTADTAGVPLIVTSSKTGGTGTIAAASTSTANAGPNEWRTAANWSLGTVPVATNDVVLSDCEVPILWGLDQSAIAALASLTKFKSHTGQIGLPINKFLTSVGTYDETVFEYREDWLKVKTSVLRLDEYYGTGQPSGSSLVKIDTLDDPTAAIVFDSGTSEDDKPPTRLKFNDPLSTLKHYGGGVAICDEEVADTGELASIEVYGSAATLIVGAGLTQATHKQLEGSAVLKNAPTTAIVEAGAQLALVGSGTITTLQKRGDLNMSGGSYTITNLVG